LALYIYFDLLLALWLVWAAYWIGSVVYESATNRTKETERRAQGTGFLFFILLILMLSPYGTRGPLGSFYFVTPPALKAAGLVVAGSSISLAIWARRHLGSNWSGTPSLKRGHELITGGPYAVVRHPIYTGLLFGTVGSTLVLGTVGSLGVVFPTALLVSVRIGQEEGLMMSQFGEAYSEYRRKAKGLIPWLF